MRSKVFLAAAVVLTLALGFLLLREHQRAEQAYAQLAGLLADKARLEAESAELQSKLVSEAELKRLQDDSREAIKLRGEVNKLKNAVTAAEKERDAARKVASAKAVTPKTEAPAEENPYVRSYQRKATAVVGFGQGVVLGDFESTPGKKTFAIAIPTVDPASPNNISIETKWIEFSDEAKEKLGEYLKPGGTSIMTSDQLAGFLKIAMETTGVDFLAAPRVTTASGMAASVSVTESRETPKGPAEFGPQINLTPTRTPDGSVHLAIDAKLTLPVEPAKPSE